MDAFDIVLPGTGRIVAAPHCAVQLAPLAAAGEPDETAIKRAHDAGFVESSRILGAQIERMEDALRSIRQHCDSLPGALAKAIVATCDSGLRGMGPAAQADVHLTPGEQGALKAALFQSATVLPEVAAIPAGFRLMPEEPTLDLGWAYLDAAREDDPSLQHHFNWAGYRAMVKAGSAFLIQDKVLTDAQCEAIMGLVPTAIHWIPGSPIHTLSLALVRAAFACAMAVRGGPVEDDNEPMLLRDLAQEVGLEIPDLAKLIAALGLGNFSTNSAVTRRVARAVRRAVADGSHQPDAKAAAERAMGGQG